MMMWRPFGVIFVAAAAAILAALLATAFLLDPYDTGRSPLQKPGVRPQGPRTAGASRGRDLSFNAAIIGNSHIQLLSPERLNAQTGLAFVQLSIVATGPKEMFPVLKWFLRHHPSPRALVIGADRLWCADEVASWNNAPFPFWLYSSGALEYIRGLLRMAVLEELPRRVRTSWRRGRREPGRTATGITSRRTSRPAILRTPPGGQHSSAGLTTTSETRLANSQRRSA